MGQGRGGVSETSGSRVPTGHVLRYRKHAMFRRLFASGVLSLAQELISRPDLERERTVQPDEKIQWAKYIVLHITTLKRYSNDIEYFLSRKEPTASHEDFG